MKGVEGGAGGTVRPTQPSLHVYLAYFAIRRWNFDTSLCCRKNLASSVKINPQVKPAQATTSSKFLQFSSCTEGGFFSISDWLCCIFCAQEHARIWEPAGVLQDTGRENREGKKRRWRRSGGYSDQSDKLNLSCPARLSWWGKIRHKKWRRWGQGSRFCDSDQKPRLLPE